MINALGSAGMAHAIDALRSDRVKPGAPAAKVAASTSETSAPATPAATLAAQGAPIDAGKVASVKASLAAGTYRINARAIADAMIEQDLPADR